MKKFELIDVDGIKLVYLKTESLTSGFGVSCLSGCSFENKEEAGISHFCEHMFFKGTKSRNYADLTKDIDIKGIKQNAFTSNFMVFYHMECAKPYIDDAIKNSLDMFQNSVFNEEEIEKERLVILEERKAYQDDHFSYMFDFFEEFCDWRLTHPTLGYEDTISKFSRDDLLKFLEDNLNRERVCLVFIGNNDKEEVIKSVRKHIDLDHSYFKEGTREDFTVEKPWLSTAPDFLEIPRPNLKQGYVLHLIPSITTKDPDYHTYKILLNGIGAAGMFNRLFMEVREKRGLAYSTGCMDFSYHVPNTSMFCAYGMIDPNRFEEYDECVRDNLESISKTGLTQDEFDCAKAQQLFRLAQASERVSLHLRTGASFIYGDSPLSVWEKMELAKKVTIEDCNNLAKKILDLEQMKMMKMFDK